MNEDNPVVARLLRAGVVESMHRGAWVVMDAGRGLTGSVGDPDQKVYARSSVKSLQALALIETGAADHFGLRPEALALAAASHAGSGEHLAGVADVLDRIGVAPEVLQCGLREPDHPDGPVAHECSGKHAGFLALARHLGQDPATYLDPAGPSQRAVAERLSEIADGAVVPDGAIDGCSAPTFRLPLRSLATGLLRLVTGTELSGDRREAGRRIVAAVAAHPHLVGGDGRFDTMVSQATGGRVFAKTGAEGVQTLVDPGSGRALAIKIDDGAPRAAPAIALALAARFELMTADEIAATGRWADPVVPNSAGRPASVIEVA